MCMAIVAQMWFLPHAARASCVYVNRKQNAIHKFEIHPGDENEWLAVYYMASHKNNNFHVKISCGVESLLMLYISAL